MFYPLSHTSQGLACHVLTGVDINTNRTQPAEPSRVLAGSQGPSPRLPTPRLWPGRVRTQRDRAALPAVQRGETQRQCSRRALQGRRDLGTQARGSRAEVAWPAPEWGAEAGPERRCRWLLGGPGPRRRLQSRLASRCKNSIPPLTHMVAQQPGPPLLRLNLRLLVSHRPWVPRPHV